MSIPDHTPIPDGYKRCTKCKEIKPNTRQYFYKLNGTTDKLRPDCKLCTLATQKKRNKDNPEKTREQSHRYYISHAEQIKKRSRNYYARNKDECQARFKSYQQSHAKEISDQKRNYRKQHPAEERERARKWTKNNPERRKEIARDWARRNRHKTREWQKRHPDKCKAWAQRYQKNHPQQVYAVTQRRRARKRGLPDSFTAEDWQRALDYFKGCCAACGRPPGLWHALAMDHWIPLTAINCPGTVPTNMVPLCNGQEGCNNSKNCKEPTEWLTNKFGPRKAKQILKRINAYFEWVREQDS